MAGGDRPGRTPTSTASADLRVIFMGSPGFALPSLEALVERVRLVGVVTRPDKPAGRGRRVTSTPVAEYARRHGIPLLQPTSLRHADVRDALAALAPDLIATAAYGRIVPPEILRLPRLGAINVHPSLLPAYRGASPVQQAIADGQTETGVTILYQVDELDAGDIILQERVPIEPGETAGALEARLAELGARLLMRAVDLVAQGRAPRLPQDAAKASYVGRLTKEAGRIDWSRSAQAIVNQVRAMDPWPTAYTSRLSQRLVVWRAEVHGGELQLSPPPEHGVVLAVDSDRILLAAGSGVVRVLEVQPEAGRRMSAGAYARGHRVLPGERWGGDPGESIPSAGEPVPSE